jgi:long-chain acyl-CoA synthetase
VYDTLGPDAVQFILAQTQVTTLFVSGEILEKLLKSPPNKPITTVVCFDPVTP